MKIRFTLLSLSLVLLVSCEDDKTPTADTKDLASDQKETITAKAIEGFKYTDYVLGSSGEQVVANWDKYQELAIQVSYLKKADLSFFNGDKALLKGFIDTLKLEIPDTLQTNPIISRTAIMETTLLRLNENLTLDNIDNSLQLESVKEVLMAFSNLNYQINKKLEKDVYGQITSDY